MNKDIAQDLHIPAARGMTRPERSAAFCEEMPCEKGLDKVDKVFAKLYNDFSEKGGLTA